MTEKEIIAGCIKNNRRCQNVLYKKYFEMMSGIALRYSYDQSQVLPGINMAFYKVLKNISRYSNEYSLATWIRKIVVNHFIDLYRKNQKHLDNLDYNSSEYIAELEGAPNLGLINLEIKDLLEMLESLPAATRKVFNLFAIDGYKHEEISDLLQISKGTSKWHVSNARKILQQKFDEAQEEEKKRNNLRLSV